MDRDRAIVERAALMLLSGGILDADERRGLGDTLEMLSEREGRAQMSQILGARLSEIVTSIDNDDRGDRIAAIKRAGEALHAVHAVEQRIARIESRRQQDDTAEDTSHIADGYGAA